MRTSRHLLVASVAVLALIAAACGSTAKTDSKTTKDAAPSVSASSGGPVVSSGPAASSARAARSDATISSGTSAKAVTTVGGIPTGTVPRSKLTAATGPGITNSVISIGIGYSSQGAAGDRAIGAAGAAPSYDERDVFNSVLDYANKHGAFAGRTVKPLYYDFNLTDDSNTQEQSACAYWTQDNKIFAMGGGDDILDACAEKAGGVPIGAGSATAGTYKKYPHLIDADAIRLDRLGGVTVSGLHKASYFTGKLGLVTWDDPDYRAAMTAGYLPALSAIGVKPTQVTYISVPQQIGALGDMTAAVSNAVAKFKALGIDHVIVQDGPAGVWAGTGLTFEWMNQAKSQKYYPRYGQNTYNSPGWSVLPADEMNKAIAIDQGDYDKSKDAGTTVNTFREECFKIEADAGYPVHSSNANDEAIAGGVCDFVFFLQRVLNGLSVVSADAFVDAAQQLGTTMPSAQVYGTKLMPGRRDGGDKVRTEEYLSSCTCLKYMGPPYYAD